ncbi:MAG: Crp/Fnr family transcriptional regulator [Dehalococcoidia bacterium]
MQTDQTTRALLAVPLFSDLPPAVVEAIAAQVRRRRYRNGEVIYHEGDPGRSLCIIETGRVKIVSVSEQGQEALLAVMGPGEFFGELALFDEMPRSADVVTMEPTQTLNLARDDFFTIIDRFPVVSKEIFGVLAKQIRRLTTEVSDIVFLNLDARIAKRLLELAEAHGADTPEGRRIEITLSQAELGSMVGATRESVNQCLRRFQDAGLILLARQRITVVKSDGLRRRINY